MNISLIKVTSYKSSFAKLQHRCKCIFLRFSNTCTKRLWRMLEFFRYRSHECPISYYSFFRAKGVKTQWILIRLYYRVFLIQRPFFEGSWTQSTKPPEVGSVQINLLSFSNVLFYLAVLIFWQSRLWLKPHNDWELHAKNFTFICTWASLSWFQQSSWILQLKRSWGF